MNNETVIFESKKENFYKRLGNCFFYYRNYVQLFYIGLLIFFACTNIYILFFFIFFLYIINVIYRVYEKKKVIYKIAQKDNSFFISYIDVNESKKKSICISNIKVKIFSGFRSPHYDCIVFYTENTEEIRQYYNKFWTPETMQSVAKKIEELKKEYKKEHETNTLSH